MESICRELALAEPDNKERWRAEAKMWHQRAGKAVTAVFGEVRLTSEQTSEAAQYASDLNPNSSHSTLTSREQR
jgi:hypothetical protein